MTQRSVSGSGRWHWRLSLMSVSGGCGRQRRRFGGDLERLVDACTRPALIEPPAESGEQRKGLSMADSIDLGTDT